MASPTFGVFIPQGWKMELASIPDPQEKWNKAVEIAVLAEELGLDSLWVYDHFHNVPVPAHEAVFECWTTIAAISQRTSRIRLGQMVGCNGYRNPGLLAKITSTIDVISGGRLDWGIGAGWYDHEFKGYGYEFGTPKERIGMLREAVEIVKAMWTQPDVTYDGTYYQLAGAQCDPKPLQQPHPPIWIGGGGEQLTLRVVARHATHSNFGGKPDEWAHKRDVLHRHCADVGRDPAEITMTWSPEVFIRETEAEVAAAGSRSFWGEPADSWTAGNLVGTPEQVSKVRAYQALGCGSFLPWCSDYPETETLRLFAEKVAPEFGSRAKLLPMGDFAEDTAVTRVDEGRFTAGLSEDWRIWGPNGGYLAAIALRAVGAAAAQPRPASIAVHFLGVAQFAPVDLEVTVIRSTRRAQSMRVSMTQAGKPIIEAMAWAIADGIEPLEHTHGTMPEVVPADEVPTMEERMRESGADGPPFPFWKNIDNRGLQWRPDWPPPGPLDPEARWWCRYRPRATFDDRWVDAARALLLVDTFGWPAAGAAHAWRRETNLIAPTIDVQATFHGFDSEEEWLLAEAVSPVGADGLVAARVSVWSAGGRLLASGGQTMLATRVAGG